MPTGLCSRALEVPGAAPRRSVVAITGASAGVGREVARAFAKRGAALGLLARDSGRLSATAAEMEMLGAAALPIPTDVADPEAVENAAASIEERLGPIDIWINNASVTVFSTVAQMTPEEYQRVTAVAYLGAVHGTLAALRRMRRRDSGTVVQVGSALAYRAIPLQSAYCGAKYALRGFTESVRSELIHERSNVRISIVELPGLNTPQFDWSRSKLAARPRPVGAVYDPDVAARAILDAALTGRREIFVGMPTIKAWLGNFFAPGFLDWLLARTAWHGQMSDLPPAGPNSPDNLFAPVAGDPGSRGRFETGSAQTAWTASRAALGLAALGTSALVATLWFWLCTLT